MSSGDAKAEMPPELVEFLSGGRLVMGSTIDAEGAPYTMVMNSVMALDASTIRFCLDRRTHTLKNIESDPRMMLQVIGDGLIFGVRGTARVIREQMDNAPIPSAMVELTVEAVKRDLPPGVQVTAPAFEWGPMGGYMVPIEEKMFEEMRTYQP
jgi:predicted pyridoxine 5'-phosphate oxidase superfamily flavin-nucleotide-binding protein